MNIVALIPARSGSKGIKNKNIIKLKNKPLINYTLESALKTKLIQEVYVSSDSDKILEVCSKFSKSINLLKRPKFLAKDSSKDLDVFKHFLKYYKKKKRKKIDILVHLRATTPLRKISTIKETILIMLKNKSYTSLRCFMESNHSPYKMYIRRGLRAIPLLRKKKEMHSRGRQFLPKSFNHVGYVDLIRPKDTLEKNSMTGKKIYFFLLNKKEYSIDIDNKEYLEKTKLFF